MLLEKLSNARGVSGDESAVRALIAAHLQKHVDEYRVDALGNILAVKRASKRGARAPFRILVAAHMDEVGFLITHIDRDGLLRFEKIGGIDDRILPAQTVLIGDQAVPGVIGLKPRHLSTESERKQVVAADALRIDLGASGRADAQRVITPGAYATFATEFSTFGDNCARGKALDDRAGCALLCELVRENFPFDLYAVFTTQEEIGLRGARVAGHAVAPNAALVLEATICDDASIRSRARAAQSFPPRAQAPITQLGAGPALTLADRRLLAHKGLTRAIAETARAEKIPFQYKQPLVGSTDAGILHRVRGGVPSAVLSVPARYIHSPAAVISLDDFQNALKLARAALPKFADALDA
ncbi:M42 family metallopeptidase [Anaerolineae bacterium CFX7]|nr:M42 family metallopeptidase [Anaerolineae bacterium CFX7]